MIALHTTMLWYAVLYQMMSNPSLWFQRYQCLFLFVEINKQIQTLAYLSAHLYLFGTGRA